jgi:hypothetical protein
MALGIERQRGVPAYVTATIKQLLLTNVCLGSETDLVTGIREVRFSTKSEHAQRPASMSDKCQRRH